MQQLQATSMQRVCSGCLFRKNIRQCKDTYRRNPIHALDNTIDRLINQICSTPRASSNELNLLIKAFEHHCACYLQLSCFYAPAFVTQETFRNNAARKRNSQSLNSSDPRSDAPSLAFTHRDIYSSFDSMHGEPFSNSKYSISFTPN